MEDEKKMKRGIATDDELGIQTEEEYLKSNQYKVDLMKIALRKLEVKTHMKTLKGGYADVIVIGQEAFDNFIPEIQEWLTDKFEGRIVFKKFMFNPIIRYIYFGNSLHITEGKKEESDNEFDIPEINMELRLDELSEDHDYSLFAQREYFVDDLDNDGILKAIETKEDNGSE